MPVEEIDGGVAPDPGRARGMKLVAVGCAVALLAARLLGGCGGETEAAGAAESDPAYDALQARTLEASSRWCSQAVACYGAPEREEYSCGVPTSQGTRSFGSGEEYCDAGIDACHRRLFSEHREAFTRLRECQIERSNGYATCLSSCPELADDCTAAFDLADCRADPELTAGFGGCFDAHCDF